ncbi:hypothetical protein PRABACTJOHN_02833 [Parabacteroides johnsonii DSM 18315]|uniref:Uncharacterized protein n=1 Tax=Parabacteroides johnsonii DSM 18315 TaxID=537006 RepID=B7BCR4_9BACT|nr:hypothetical protein PRABACTJOHN_02833 [Parabacteroides johnsonii DSM 18315]
MRSLPGKHPFPAEGTPVSCQGNGNFSSFLLLVCRRVTWIMYGVPNENNYFCVKFVNRAIK